MVPAVLREVGGIIEDGRKIVTGIRLRRTPVTEVVISPLAAREGTPRGKVEHPGID